MRKIWLGMTLSIVTGAASVAETVTFPAADGLTVTADLYVRHPQTVPCILLFHQAGWSRGEYEEIAPKLNELGFNVMAVDQRSGSSVNGVKNETAALAQARKLATGYLDAMPDLKAAIAYAKKDLAKGRLILWGSSYSASLVLKIAGDDPASCDAVLAFSPGEYFSPKDLIAKSAASIKVPAFITSSPYEKSDWAGIFDAIRAPGKKSFLPDKDGQHGSSALWKRTKGSDAYWKEVEAFLKALK